MHCKYLKLTNGDNIIVTTDDACNTLKEKEFISVVDPVVLNSFKFSRGQYVVESYVMEPWIKVAKEDVFNIPTKTIIVAVDVDEAATKYYHKFIEETKTKKVFIKDQEETKQFFENTEQSEFEELMEGILEDNEEEDEVDDGPEYIRDGRVIH